MTTPRDEEIIETEQVLLDLRALLGRKDRRAARLRETAQLLIEYGQNHFGIDWQPDSHYSVLAQMSPEKATRLRALLEELDD